MIKKLVNWKISAVNEYCNATIISVLNEYCNATISSVLNEYCNASISFVVNGYCKAPLSYSVNALIDFQGKRSKSCHKFKFLHRNRVACFTLTFHAFNFEVQHP